MNIKHLCEVRILEITCHILIKDLKIDVSANQHAKAEIWFELLDISKTDKLVEQVSQEKITLLWKNEVFFCGKCMSIQVLNKNKIKLEVVSLSIMLDINREKRSYQDIQMTWENIMWDAISLCNGMIEYNAIKGKPDMPVIQYMETTWEFIRRLASKINTVIYPDYIHGKKIINVGIPNVKNTQVSFFLKKISINKKYWMQSKNSTKRDVSQFIFYEILSYENYEIGTIVDIQNAKKYILEKRIDVKNSNLIFIYRLGDPAMVYMDKYDNKKFAGMTIQATVLHTANETVKLQFEFDDKQDVEKAYPYQWVPETGNIMYVMPKVGTLINLFFMDESEESALAVSCIRENGKSHSKLKSAAERYFTNEEGKQIYLKPKEMGFINEETNNGISIQDSDKIQLITNNDISVISNNKLCISAKNIFVSTPNEFLAKKISL